MTKKDKKEMYDLLVDFHENITTPTIKAIVQESEERVTARIDSVDMKLTKMLDRHSQKLDDHEEQIEKLESAMVV